VATFAVYFCVGQTLPPAPRYIIDLDSDPLTRWNEVFSPVMLQQLLPVKQWLDSIISPEIQNLLAPIVAQLDKYFPIDYANELRGIATLTAPVGFDLGILVGMNLIYDISAGCTSIVAQTSTGEILHARNLDYPIPNLQNITIQVDFRSSGKTQYTATTFAGYVGVLTGLRPFAWSVSVNERDHPGNQADNILAMLEGGASIGMFLRTALASQPSFQSALNLTQHVKLMAPVYLTMAGANPGEGAVVTRDRDGPADVWFLLPPSQFYLIETNDDHWLPPTDDRRAAAYKSMSVFSMTNVSLTGILNNVLSQPPVFQTTAVYTALISPLQASYVTYLRHVNINNDKNVRKI